MGNIHQIFYNENTPIYCKIELLFSLQIKVSYDVSDRSSLKPLGYAGLRENKALPLTDPLRRLHPRTARVLLIIGKAYA